jgi:hypothetical protein
MLELAESKMKVALSITVSSAAVFCWKAFLHVSSARENAIGDLLLRRRTAFFSGTETGYKSTERVWEILGMEEMIEYATAGYFRGCLCTNITGIRKLDNETER